MSEEDIVLRRRKASTENLSLNLETCSKVYEGCPKLGTSTPSVAPDFIITNEATPSNSMVEFRKKQQSFDIQIEECEEEEMCTDSDSEGDSIKEPVVPLPLHDYGSKVTYQERPQTEGFLRIRDLAQDALTDVSDDSEGNED